MKWIPGGLASLLLLSSCSTLQRNDRSAASAGRPIDLGQHRWKVTTASPEAQGLFNRALILAYAFSYQAAEKEFRQALKADPQMAMAHWGIALVNGPHINFPLVPPENNKTALAALTQAQSLSTQSSSLEKKLISALQLRHLATPPDDRSALDLAYAQAMRQLWQEHPQHPEVGTLFAESMMDLRPWDLWKSDGQPQPGTEEIVATLERVLSLNPRHPGANHLYIHAIEASPHPEKGIASADRLLRLAPGSGHLVHMPAHIYARVGNWEGSAEANRRAMKADAVYRAANPRPGFYAIYMAHNSHFYAFTAMMQGRSSEALLHARRLVAEMPDDFLSSFAPVADGFLAFPVEVLMRFGRWEELLAEPRPKGNLPLSTALWHFTRAVALTALDRTPEARQEREKFMEAQGKLPGDYTFGNNSATNLLAIATHQLDGEILARSGKLEEAIVQLKTAARIEDGLRYDEPPDWIQPVRHSLGAVLLRAGRPAEAETVYREDLARFPHNGWSYYGLNRALAAQSRSREAAEARRNFDKAWKAADVRLTTTCFCLK